MKHYSAKVFFANFPFSMSDSEITHFLEQVGSINHLEVFVNEQGSSRGCGIAEYSTNAQANEAVRRLNSTRIYGRAITVKPDDNSKGRIVAQKTYALAVQNIPQSVTWQQLKDVFREVGPVARADVSVDRHGKSTGRGTVFFEKHSDAEEAIRVLNGAFFNSNQVRVEYEGTPRS
jgi:RNA recognition motif-containing protein